jgi:O-methyltransferase
MLNAAFKHIAHHLGYKIERRDALEESIPADYNHSPFLPRVYRGSLDRIMYFRDQLERVATVEGDIVECGVSIGHGALLFLLLSEYIGVERTYYGFDSFEGFPAPVEKDEKTPITGRDFWANPPETVMKVLRDGRIPEEKIRQRVRLMKGWFQNTLPKYEGGIALLHLDCDLYESYKVALQTLYPKVRAGGIIMFDEYGDQRWPGATKAVDEFFSDMPERVRAHEKCNWKYYVQKMAAA